ncbi:hypothetical protein ACFL0K_02120 [Patescibacteria group bacterium]
MKKQVKNIYNISIKKLIPFLLVSVFLFSPFMATAQGGSLGSNIPVPPTYGDSPFECNMITKPVECVGSIIYNVFFVTSAKIMASGAFVFDLLVAFSMSRDMLNAQFVKDSWSVMRDLANMLFIFILLFIAIATILQLSKYNAKELLTRLIIFALLVNFSLFVSRVVIDAGNITALFFYDGIAVSSAPGASTPYSPDAFLKSPLDVEIKSIAAGLGSSIDPQNLFRDYSKGKVMEENAGSLIFIYIAGTILFLAAAWIFFSIAFLFLGRLVVLWFLMALAPLAFVAMIPKTGKIGGYAQKWWSELFSKSFCITVFMFFLWLIAMFGQNNVIKDILKDPASPDFNIVATVTVIILHFGVLIGMLFAAKKITMGMCNQIGNESINIGKKLAGFAGMAVGGGVGVVGRRVGGRFARQYLNKTGASGALKREELAGGGFASKAIGRSLAAAERGSWDVRAPIGATAEKIPLAKEVGIDVGALGTPQKGGVEQTFKDMVKGQQSYINKFKTDAEKKMAAEYVAGGGALGWIPGYTGVSRLEADARQKAGKDTQKKIQAKEFYKTNKDKLIKLEDELSQIKAEPVVDKTAVANKEIEIREVKRKVQKYKEQEKKDAEAAK